MSTSGTPRAAASRGEAVVRATPQTSLMRSAPASRAAAATAGLVVSTLIGTSGRAARTAAMTGTTRADSSPSSTGAWPGRVDSPPTSRRSAPSATIRRAAATAARDRVVGRQRAGRRRRTSPGVTLRMPITNVRAPQAKRGRADPGGVVMGRSRRSGRRRAAADRADEVERAGTTTGRRRRPAPARRPSATDVGRLDAAPAVADRAPRQRRAPGRAAGSARGTSTACTTIVASAQGRRRGQGREDAGDVLVGHRRRQRA